MSNIKDYNQEECYTGFRAILVSFYKSTIETQRIILGIFNLGTKLYKLHALCRSKQLSYCINYDDGSNRFSIAINSPSPSECYITPCRSEVIDVITTTINYLEKQ